VKHPEPAWLGRDKIKEYLIAALLLGLVYGLLVVFLPVALDWHCFFWPAAHHWRDPYAVTGGYFHNPPWLVFFLIPFGLVPEVYGWAAFVLASFLILIDTARALGATKGGTIVALFTPPALSTIANGQIDILVLWGVALGIRAREHENPWLLSLGLLLISIKPQVAGMVGLLLWLDSKDKFRPLILPFFVAILSFVMYGWWPAKWNPVEADVSWNISAWPWGIPAGALLAIVAYKYRSELVAFWATLLVVPYLAAHSLVGAATATVSKLSMTSSIVVVAIWWLLELVFKGRLLF
jgi:hypothetical protein